MSIKYVVNSNTMSKKIEYFIQSLNRGETLLSFCIYDPFAVIIPDSMSFLESANNGV
jgi:hypothetical protein